MIVVDLDGTLLNEKRKVSDATKEYLNILKSRGYTITIATGRTCARALKATDGARFANYLISDTGACVYDISNGKILSKKTIKKEFVEKILKYYNDDFRSISVCDKSTIYEYTGEANDSGVSTTKDKDYILNNCLDVSHVVISMKDNDAVTSLYRGLSSDIPELETIIMQDSFSDRLWLELMPKGCSKYSGISELANHLNIANDEIIAFGDGLNDIEMLEKCGYGVALQNALPEVKIVADDVTTFDYKNDGVIDYLKGYLDGN